MFCISFAIACFVLLHTCFAYGAPNITAVDKTNNYITISGAGFGAHQDFDANSERLIYIFEDCEQGVIQAAPKGWLGWASITSAYNRTGSSYSAFHERRATDLTYTTVFGDTVTSSVRYGIKVDVQDVAPVHHYFMSQWIRLSDDFGNIEASIDNQVKLLMTTPFDEVGGKDYFQTRGAIPPPLRTETESGQLSQSHGPIEDYMPYGSWHRMDMWVSVPDTTTGMVDEIKWWIDGKLIRIAKQTDGYLQPNPEDVHKVGLVSFIGYIDNSSDVSFSLQTDDHFLDFTMARVEISDSPIWDETVQVHKEIQIPTAWSDTSITVAQNQGSFATGDTAYLYVIDSSGAVSNGYPITIGAGTGPLRSAGTPTGEQPAGTAQVTMSLTTDEAATCRYSTIADTAYADMTDTFATTGGTSHSTVISGLANGGSYTYYVRCAGTDTNADDYVISWSVQREHHRTGSMPVIH